MLAALRVPLLAAFALALALPAPAEAQSFDPDRPFEITAHEIEFDAERGVLVARRKVRLVQGADSLKADWVAFEEYNHQMWQRLTVSEPAREMGRFLFRPPNLVLRPAMRWLRTAPRSA